MRPTLDSVPPNRFVAIDIESKALTELRLRQPDAQPWLRKTDSAVVRTTGGRSRR